MPEVIVVKRKSSDEFLNLVSSLGYEISEVVTFKNATNPKFYISRGKVDEIKRIKDEKNVEKVIIDGILKSSQWFNLEKEIGVRVEDRIKLIIDIFADRAKSKEAKLQVEYARLKYEIPLIREVIHHLRMGEHAGWMGAGEYEIADYYEMIRRRMARIRKTLEKIRVEREERRKKRRKMGFILVGMAGYTNAGKSTLLNYLTSSGVAVEERMFSTLSTKTSRIGKEMILITDTVGFVEDMPPWLIEAFRPTLEEIYGADVVILLLDGSDTIEEFKRKFNITLDILSDRVEGKIIPVINKIDIATDIEDKMEIVKGIGEPICISAKNGTGVEKLIDRIEQLASIRRYVAKVKILKNDVISLLESYARIENISYDENGAVITFSIRENLIKELRRKFDVMDVRICELQDSK